MADSLLQAAEHDFGELLKPFLPMYETFVSGKIVPNFAPDGAREREEMEGLIEGLKRCWAPGNSRRSARSRLRPHRPHRVEHVRRLVRHGLLVARRVGASQQRRHAARGPQLRLPWAFDLVTDHGLIVVRAADGEYAGKVSVTYPRLHRPHDGPERARHP
ncbi:MAG: hypothetical protein R3F05_08195 [Planctomycetota bacterium]